MEAPASKPWSELTDLERCEAIALLLGWKLTQYGYEHDGKILPLTNPTTNKLIPWLFKGWLKKYLDILS